MAFRVDMSATVAQQFEELKRLGRQIGIAEEVRKALYAIVEQLKADPYRFGEPAEELVHLKLHVRSGFLNPVSVRFAVNDEHALVYIMKVEMPMS